MESGRDLDYLIGEKLFNLKGGYTVPEFSTDMSCAWLIVEKLNDDNFWIESNGTHWKIGFGKEWAGSTSAPHAICLAALRSEGINV